MQQLASCGTTKGALTAEPADWRQCTCSCRCGHPGPIACLLWHCPAAAAAAVAAVDAVLLGGGQGVGGSLGVCSPDDASGRRHVLSLPHHHLHNAVLWDVSTLGNGAKDYSPGIAFSH